MQTIAVFATVLAVASAATLVSVPSANSAVIESHRLGGSFSYSTQEGLAHAVVSPQVVHQNVVSPVATTYSLSGYPYTTVNGLQGYQGYQVVSNANTLGNVAVVRTSDLSGVQYVPATSVVQAGTPANTYKHIAGVSPLSNVGVYQVSSV